MEIQEDIKAAKAAHAKTCQGWNISDNALANNMRQLCSKLCDVVNGWQQKCLQYEGTLAAQQEEIDRLKAELAMVDEALARRPAVADSPNRYTSICAAFNMASRTEKAESMEKHWKFHFDRLEAENAKLQARLAARAKTEATG